MKNRQRLKLDLESLFPGDTLKIGDQSIDIRPLGIRQLAEIIKKLESLTSSFKEEGIDWENFKTPENLLKIATELLARFPEVLEEASNVAIEDLEVLPIDIVVEILDKILEVNISSFTKLEGNFKSLAEKFSQIPMTNQN